MSILNAELTDIPLHSLDPENVYYKPAQLISCGLVQYFERPLKDAKQQLSELQKKQTELVAKLHSENLNISEVQHSAEIQAVFAKMKLYHTKLLAIKRNIRLLHARSQKLKKRALKLKDARPCEEIIITKPVQLSTGGSTQSSSNSM